jgi:protein SCO1/2
LSIFRSCLPHCSRIITGISFVFAALVLTACSGDAKFKSTDVTGATFARDFHLTDHNGKPRTLADFKGKALVIFFGYTHCPDFCPTTLAEMAEALHRLGDKAKEVQVLFVTLDPERDTSQILAQYVPAFHPSFLGLTGSAEEVAAVAKEFKAVYQKQDGGENYTLDHSTGTYVYDPSGRLRLYMSYGQGADVLAHDLKILLAE